MAGKVFDVTFKINGELSKNFEGALKAAQGSLSAFASAAKASAAAASTKVQEIGQRIAKLNQQAADAARFSQLQNNLQAAQTQAAASSRKADQDRQAYQQNEKLIAALTKKIEDLKVARDSLDKKAPERAVFANQITEAQNALKAVKAERSALNKEQKASEKASKLAAQDLAKKLGEIQNLQQKLTEGGFDTKNYSASWQKLQNDVSAATRELERHQQALKNLQTAQVQAVTSAAKNESALARTLEIQVNQRAKAIRAIPVDRSVAVKPIDSKATEAARLAQAHAVWNEFQRTRGIAQQLESEWRAANKTTSKLTNSYRNQQALAENLWGQYEALREMQRQQKHVKPATPEESAQLLAQIKQISDEYAKVAQAMKATKANIDRAQSQGRALKSSLESQREVSGTLFNMLSRKGFSTTVAPQDLSLGMGTLGHHAEIIRAQLDKEAALVRSLEIQLAQRAKNVSAIPVERNFQVKAIDATAPLARQMQINAAWGDHQRLRGVVQQLETEWRNANLATAKLAGSYRQQQAAAADLKTQLESLKETQKDYGKFLSPQQSAQLANTIRQLSEAYDRANQSIKATGVALENSKNQGRALKSSLESQRESMYKVFHSATIAGLRQPPDNSGELLDRLKKEALLARQMEIQLAQRAKAMSALPSKAPTPMKAIDTALPLADKVKKVEAVWKEYQRLGNVIQQLRKEWRGANDTTARLASTFKRQQAAAAELKTQLDQLKTVQKDYGKSLSLQATTQLENQIQRLSEAYAKAMSTLKTTGANFDVSKAQGAGLKASIQNQVNAARQLESVLNTAGYSTSNLASAQSRLRAELDATAAAMNREQVRTRSQEAMSNFSSAYTDFQNVTSSIQSAVAPFTASVKVAKDFEKQMSVVKSLTQMDNLRVGNLEKANAEMKELTEMAEHLGMTTQFTALQAAQGETYLAYAGWTPQQILAAMPSLLNLATAANMTDLGRVADVYSNIMSGFKIPATEAERVADVLTYTFTHSNQNLEDLAETMKYAAPIARLFGSSLEETAAITKFMADAGIKGSMGGTAMRSLMTRLVAPPKAAYEAMEANGISVGDATKDWMDAVNVADTWGIKLQEGVSPGKQMASIIHQINENLGHLSAHEKLGVFKAITGMYALAGSANLFETGGELIDDEQNPGKKITRIEAFTRSLETSNGAAEQTAQVQLDNYAGAVTLFNSALENLQTQIGQAITPALRAVTEAFTPLVQRLAEFVNVHPEVVQGAAAIAAGLSAVAVGAAGLVLAFKGITFIGAGLAEIGTRVGEFMLLMRGITIPPALLSWPALFALMKTKIGAAVTFIMTKLGALVAAIRGLTFASIVAGAKSLGMAFVGLGRKILTAIKAFTLLAISPAGVTLMALAAIAIAVYKNWDKVGPVLEHVAGVLGGSLSAAFQTVQPAISSAIKAFEHLFEVIGSGNSGEILAKTFVAAVNVIVGALATMVDFAANAFAALADIVAGGADIVAHVADGDWSGAWEAAKKHGEDFKNHAWDAAAAIPRGIENTYNNTKKSFEIYDERERNLPEERRKAEAAAYGKQLRNQQILSLQRHGIDPDEFFKQRREQVYHRAKMQSAGYGHYDEYRQWHGDEEGYRQYLKDRDAERNARIDASQAEIQRRAEAMPKGIVLHKEWDYELQRYMYSLPDPVRDAERKLFAGRTKKVKDASGNDVADWRTGNVKYTDRHALSAAELKAIAAAQQQTPTVNISSPEAETLEQAQLAAPKTSVLTAEAEEAWRTTLVPPQAAAKRPRVTPEQIPPAAPEVNTPRPEAEEAWRTTLAPPQAAAKRPHVTPEQIQPTAPEVNIPSPEAVRNSALPTPEDWARAQANAYKAAEAWQATPVPLKSAVERHRITPEQLQPALKLDVYQPKLSTSYTPGQQAGFESIKTPPVQAPPQQQEASTGGALMAALSSVFSPLLMALDMTSSRAAAATPESVSQPIDTTNVQTQLNSLGTAATSNATALTTNAQNFSTASTSANQSLSAILNSTDAFGQHLLSIANSTAETGENLSAVQAPAQETANSLEQSASTIQTINETFSQATQTISESVSQISTTYSEALSTAGTSITEASTLIVNSTAQINEGFAQASASILTLNGEAQTLTASFTANNSAVQQSTSSFTANTAAVQQNTAAAQAAAASLSALSGAANGAVGGISALGSSSAGAADSVSALGAAASNAVATMNNAAVSISNAAASASAAAASAGSPAQNYKGGIYNKGAFLTWFAEKSPEAAIPLDGSDRAINLWQQTGAMLGVYPSEDNSGFSAAPNLIPAENYNGGIYEPGGREVSTDAQKRLMERRAAQVEAYRQAAIAQGTLNTGKPTDVSKVVVPETPAVPTPVVEVPPAPEVKTPPVSNDAQKRLMERRAAQVEAYRQAAIAQGTLNTGKPTDVSKVVVPETPAVPAPVVEVPPAPEVKTPPVSNDAQKRLMERRAAQVEAYRQAAIAQGTLNTGKPTDVSKINAPEISTPAIDSTGLEKAAGEFSKSAETLQDAAKTMQKVEEVKPREEPKGKNFLEKGIESVNDFFFKIFHPRKYAAKKRGYETDELENIVGLNGVEGNYITGDETVAVQKAKREAQLKEYQEMRARLDRGEEYPPIVSERAAYEEIPQPPQKVSQQQVKVPEWALNPTPTFPTPTSTGKQKIPDWAMNPTPTFPPQMQQPRTAGTWLEQIFMPSSVKNQRRIQGALDEARQRNLGADVKGSRSYQALTSARRPSKAQPAMMATHQWSGRGVIDQLNRGNWKGALGVLGRMYSNQLEIKNRNTVANQTPMGTQLAQAANFPNVPEAQNAPQNVNSKTNVRSKNFLEKGIEAASSYFYKIFHPRKNAAKILDYETDELGNIKNLGGNPENIITADDSKQVKRKKQGAQSEEYRQKLLARKAEEPAPSITQADTEKPEPARRKNFLEKTFEAAGNMFGFAGKRNAFADWDVRQDMTSNLGRVIYNMFGGDQTGVHNPPQMGGLLGGGGMEMIKHIVSEPGSGGGFKLGALIDDYFTPSSVKNQRRIQGALDEARQRNLGADVKGSRSYQALTSARRPSKAQPAMMATHQWSGRGVIDQLNRGNWKGALGVLGRMYSNRLEIKDRQNPQGAPYLSTFPAPQQKSGGLNFPFPMTTPPTFPVPQQKSGGLNSPIPVATPPYVAPKPSPELVNRAGLTEKQKTDLARIQAAQEYLPGGSGSASPELLAQAGLSEEQIRRQKQLEYQSQYADWAFKPENQGKPMPTPAAGAVTPQQEQNLARLQVASQYLPGNQAFQMQALTSNSEGSFAQLDTSARSSTTESMSMPPISLTFTINIQGNADRNEVEAGVRQSVPIIQESFESQWRKFQHEQQRRGLDW